MHGQADFHRKCISKKIEDRQEAADLLGDHFLTSPEKVQAWQDLQRLTKDEDGSVRLNAVTALGTAFSHIPEKSLAWHDLLSLTQDKDCFVRKRAAYTLGMVFSQVSDKDQAWHDLLSLTQDKDGFVRGRAAYTLGTVFSQVSDKDQARQDLISLTQNEDRCVRGNAVYALITVFSQVSEKSLAWQDFHGLTEDTDRFVRLSVVHVLRTVFNQVSNKGQAWHDLIRLTQDEDHGVRKEAASSLKSALGYVSDKDQAWHDLIKLTQDDDIFNRRKAADALRAASGQVSDKDQVWHDLIRLTQDMKSDVQWGAVSAMGTVFSQVSDKDQAWQDLIRLAQDDNSEIRMYADPILDREVRMYAYHSLGRVSIFKATEAKDKNTLKMELEAAVKYFEKSSRLLYSPSEFCYPFYRTYLAIIFQDEKKEEVQTYLAEAKKAVGGSESKNELLKAVENLARALQESQRLKEKSVLSVANELNAYRWYCEEAADHMAAVEDKAPGAVKLMRKCNPLLEERIQATIADIQEKARQIYQITCGSGTEYEALSFEIQKSASHLSTDDIVRAQKCSSNIVKKLKTFCGLLPEVSRELACNAVDEIEIAPEFPNKLEKIDSALSYVFSAVEISLQYKHAIAGIRAEVQEAKAAIAFHDEKSNWGKEAILNRLDANESAIIEAIQKDAKKATLLDPELADLLHNLEVVISDLEKQPISDLVAKEIIEEVKNDLKNTALIEDPVLRLKIRIEGILPFIPKVLEILGLPILKGELEFSGGINLKAAWNKVSKRFETRN